MQREGRSTKVCLDRTNGQWLELKELEAVVALSLVTCDVALDLEMGSNYIMWPSIAIIDRHGSATGQSRNPGPG
jgi:hypothetical protein